MTPNPLALIAEITHRCPLHCVYCSNPLQMIGAQSELATEEWIRVFQEAARLGILHVHLTGGGPLGPPGFKEVGEGGASGGPPNQPITSGNRPSVARAALIGECWVGLLQFFVH